MVQVGGEIKVYMTRDTKYRAIVGSAKQGYSQKEVKNGVRIR